MTVPFVFVLLLTVTYFCTSSLVGVVMELVSGEWAVQPATMTSDVAQIISAADEIERKTGVPRLPARDGFSTFECEGCTCVRRVD
ncbi:hypothetical protein D4765_11710 [Subtercola vilae]|uniref:Uncharacterized protein n=1 Tax=Subtercola vilae TaxID=2056433 RepID=A0A4T2BT65_9MICO|nr:hypothetical protein D4765_11710 [Subtercola vilae]